MVQLAIIERKLQKRREFSDLIDIFFFPFVVVFLLLWFFSKFFLPYLLFVDFLDIFVGIVTRLFFKIYFAVIYLLTALVNTISALISWWVFLLLLKQSSKLVGYSNGGLKVTFIYFFSFSFNIDFYLLFFLLGEQLQAPPPGKLSPERDGFFNSDADQKAQGPEVEMVGIFCPFRLLFSQVLSYLLLLFYSKKISPFFLGI